MIQHLRETPKISRWLATWMALQTADVTVTIAVLAQGGMEANPMIAAGLATFGPAFWAVKLAVAYASGLMLQKNPKWARSFAWTYVALVGWNLLQLT